MASKRFNKLPKNTSELTAGLIEKLLPEIKKNCTTKFNESVDLSFQINNKQKKSEINIRTVVNLPGGTGKKVKVAVVCEDAKAEEAKKAGADIVGAEDLMESIQGGDLSFDRCIATPDMMPIVGRLGKVLGPRNLMPNPKLGTVTPDVAQAVSAAKSGEVQFKAEKAGVVHAGIGKVSFEKEKFIENYKAFMTTLNKSRPSGAKGVFIKKVSVSSTMGKSMVIDNES